MTQPRVLLLRAPGVNCDQETAFAFEKVGAKTELLHVNRVLERPALLADYQIFCLPGGFSYGDDVAAGKILGEQLRRQLGEPLRDFVAKGKLVLGVCNGFQILIRSGLLLPDDPQLGPQATLTWNESGRFTDRWVNLAVDGSKCVFLKGIEQLELPIAHAEGRFVGRNAETLAALAQNGQLALRYGAPRSDYSAPLPFPENPNGAQANVAGVCDATGRVFGLMPHPERFIDPTQHPCWTRNPKREEGAGLQIFRNAVKYVSA
ncbi:MAG TPA: phosphoribosylformylglycinamidine synthase I [Pirellulales bacterium]